MTADSLHALLQAHSEKANALLGMAATLAGQGDIDALLLVLAQLRDESFACGVLCSDLQRVQLH